MKKKIILFPIVSILIALITLHTAMAQSWNITGNTNATSSAKLGTNNANPLRLVTNNLERVRIDASGKVGIGTTSPLNILTVKLNGSTPAASWLAGGGSLPAFLAFGENQATGFNLATAANSSGYRPVLNTRRSRGTLAVPKAVVNDDFLASFVSSGYDGSTFQNPATIDFYVDGTPSSGNVPGRISFVTGSNKDNRAERLKVGSNGNINFNNNQLFVRQADGFVGIGTVTPSAKLEIGDPLDNTAIRFTKSGLNYGAVFVKTHATSGVETISAYNSGNGAGLYASAVDFVGIQAYSLRYHGIYASTNGTQINGIYAGFFSGAVNASGGYFNTSDETLKKNIKDFTSALNIIKQLKPKHYEFRNDGDYKLLNLPEGEHFGLLAQDVEKILPELVGNTRFETRLANHTGSEADAKNSKTLTYKSLNYTELIPIVIKGMQEQQAVIENEQATIEKQQRQINQLQKMVETLVNNANAASSIKQGAYLAQNTPNPFSQNTVIHCIIPFGINQAQLIIYNIDGKQLKTYALNNTGLNKITINAATLSSGSYVYTLSVEGKIVDSKSMVITK